jgi:hypothetical protein
MATHWKGGPHRLPALSGLDTDIERALSAWELDRSCATLPLGDFIAAWRADSIGYPTEPFTARDDFRQIDDVDAATALRRALPMAARWLAGDVDNLPVPPGSLGGAAALDRLAELAETGLEPWQHGHLAYFVIRVGARRLADAAACLAFIGEDKAAQIAEDRPGSSVPCSTRWLPAIAPPWHGCCASSRRCTNSSRPALAVRQAGRMSLIDLRRLNGGQLAPTEAAKARGRRWRGPAAPQAPRLSTPGMGDRLGVKVPWRKRSGWRARWMTARSSSSSGAIWKPG